MEGLETGGQTNIHAKDSHDVLLPNEHLIANIYRQVYEYMAEQYITNRTITPDIFKQNIHAKIQEYINAIETRDETRDETSIRLLLEHLEHTKYQLACLDSNICKLFVAALEKPFDITKSKVGPKTQSRCKV